MQTLLQMAYKFDVLGERLQHIRFDEPESPFGTPQIQRGCCMVVHRSSNVAGHRQPIEENISLKKCNNFSLHRLYLAKALRIITFEIVIMR